MISRLRLPGPARPLLIAVLLNAAAVLPAGAQNQKLPAPVAAAAEPVRDGQGLIKQHDYPAALAKFDDALRAANAIPPPALRLFYQVTSRVGSATALTAMRRYDEALTHADWTAQTVATAQAKTLPTELKAAVHHVRGVILYHLKRTDEARAMFEQAGREGDKTAEAWRSQLDGGTAAAAPEAKPSEMAAMADTAAQRGEFPKALILYATALQQFESLGDATASVMERTVAVAVRINPPPPVPSDAEKRLAATDAVLRGGRPADLEAARDMLQEWLIPVPWWSDGWRRLADVEDKLGNAAAVRGALRFYLQAAPFASDRRAVEQRIAGLNHRVGPAPAAAPPYQPPVTPTYSPPPAPIADLSGNWVTDDGRILRVVQTGNQVTWDYTGHKG